MPGPDDDLDALFEAAPEVDLDAAFNAAPSTDPVEREISPEQAEVALARGGEEVGHVMRLSPTSIQGTAGADPSPGGLLAPTGGDPFSA